MRLERRYESRQIAERVEAVAGAIDRDLRDRPLVVVSILKGSAFFMADLARKLRGPFSCEYLHVRRAEGAHEVLQIDFASGFTVRGQARPAPEGRRPHGRHRDLPHGPAARAAAPRSLHLAAIVDKPLDRKTNVTVDFSLFSSEGDGLFAGYGMEHEGLHAHLPDIYEVVPEQ